MRMIGIPTVQTQTYVEEKRMRVNYTTHKELRSRLRRIKSYNTQARVLALDVGTRFTGLAISCRDLRTSKGLKTI